MVGKSKTHTITVSSLTKAESIAAFTAAKAAWHLQFILQELGFPQDGATEIHIDNQAALQIINDRAVPEHAESRVEDEGHFFDHHAICAGFMVQRFSATTSRHSLCQTQLIGAWHNF